MLAGIHEPPTVNSYISNHFKDFPVYLRRDTLKSHNLKLHVQPGIELNFTLGGQGTFVVDDQILRPALGQLLIFPGSLPHQVFIDPSTLYHRLVMLIDDQKLASFLPNQQIVNLSRSFCRLLQPEPDMYLKMRRLLFQIHEEMRARKTGWKQMILAGMLELSVMIERTSEQQEETESLAQPQRMNRKNVITSICAYVEDHIHEDLSLNKIAKIFHMTPDHLIRLFKKEKGITYYQYVMMQRVLEGKKLLRVHTNMPITEVAFAAGFSSSSHFGKIFKRVTGQTPTQYRHSS